MKRPRLLTQLALKVPAYLGRLRRRIFDREGLNSQPPPSRIPVMLSFLLPCLAIAYGLFTTPVYSGNADLWRTQSIYQVEPFRPLLMTGGDR
jgi:hypothetical protein